MSTNLRFVASVAAAVISFIASDAHASGGGSGSGFGGSSTPSVSAPQYDVAAEFQSGIDAMKASRFKDAQRAFDRVLSANPRHVQGNFMAGFSRASQGNGSPSTRGVRAPAKTSARSSSQLIAAPYRCTSGSEPALSSPSTFS